MSGTPLVVPGVNIEQVAALKPDLILAINDFGLELDYPNLTKIAPTVGFKTVWGAQSWQEQTLVGAKALGLEERGRQEVAKTEAVIRAVRDANRVEHPVGAGADPLVAGHGRPLKPPVRWIHVHPSRGLRQGLSGRGG